jgi:hypothetical protein
VQGLAALIARWHKGQTRAKEGDKHEEALTYPVTQQHDSPHLFTDPFL